MKRLSPTKWILFIQEGGNIIFDEGTIDTEEMRLESDNASENTPQDAVAGVTGRETIDVSKDNNL